MVHMLLSMDNMHGILRQLYTDMMTLCEGMTSVASGIAGLGALLYICYRVWQSLARGEAIDLFPLLRPFALGICIMFFPTLVLGSLNGILSPVVQATHSLWLPISDLFSAIFASLQILSLQQETTSGTAVTLIFMVIGICGYMCIPSISTWIVQTGGISSFNHTVARTTTLAAGLMGMAAGKGYAGGKAAWHGVRWVAGKLRGTRQ